MHYIVGDVHGCYDDMMDLLNKIEEHDSDAQIIFVGDFIDRGPDVSKVLEWCLSHITPDGKYQSVRGNHEQMAIEWYKKFLEWWKEGGFYGENRMPETYYDFSKWMDAMGKLSPEGLKPYNDFFMSLPYSKKISIKTSMGDVIDYRIVHAFYNYDEKISEEDQHYTNLYARACGNYENDEVIMHGHTPTIALATSATDSLTYDCRPGLISYYKNDINVDCGCVFKDGYSAYPVMLGAICLETLEEIYAVSIEEKFQMNDSQNAMKKYEDYRNKFMKEESRERMALMKKYMKKSE